ncbi:MAG: FAD:protein FMN transferase [Planctomycetaceae bacterium]|jgi:thiamine biosynthesis lipoprotein|nr:FAD:protein FMN transferase [Planctomycetaceae bacterium]
MSNNSNNTESKKFFIAIFYVGLIVVISIGVIFYIFRKRHVEYVDQHVEGTAMGTLYSIRVHDFPKDGNWNDFVLNIQKCLEQLEQKMSLFRADSEVSRFNETESLDWFSVSHETAEVVKLALDISKISGGAFDITAASIVTIWGFGSNRKRRSIDEIVREIGKLKTKIGYEKLDVQLNPPAIKKSIPELKINLSGIAKGYAVDSIAQFCENSGLANYMIEIGGEIRCKGNKGNFINEVNNKNKNYSKNKISDWKIGIETPVIIPRGDWGEIYRIIIIGDQSMATSGGNRNFHLIDGKYYSHLIDPRTGFPCQYSGSDKNNPAENNPAKNNSTENNLTENNSDKNNSDSDEQLGSVSVLDKSCARADALATALFVLGKEDGLRVANENNIPVMFLMRKSKNIHEVTSNSFYKSARKFE